MIDRRQLVAGCLLAAAVTLAPPAATHAAAATAVACTVVAEAESGRILVRDGACDRRFSPMSSFKLPLAVMGFDAGVLIDATHPRWDYRPEFDAPERNRKPIDPTTWEAESVVWYSQEITRKLGLARFRGYVDAFGYGNRDVSDGPEGRDALTQSWLMSSLEISPDEQVAFVRALLARRLGVSAHAYAMTEAVIPVFAAEGGWTVHGKTGSGWLRDAGGAVDRARPHGWFVGWARKDGRTLAFARLVVNDGRSKEPMGLMVRKAFLAELGGLGGLVGR